MRTTLLLVLAVAALAACAPGQSDSPDAGPGNDDGGSPYPIEATGTLDYVIRDTATGDVLCDEQVDLDEARYQSLFLAVGEGGQTFITFRLTPPDTDPVDDPRPIIHARYTLSSTLPGDAPRGEASWTADLAAVEEWHVRATCGGTGVETSDVGNGPRPAESSWTLTGYEGEPLETQPFPCLGAEADNCDGTFGESDLVGRIVARHADANELELEIDVNARIRTEWFVAY